jgi:hypothetical protein
MQKSTSVDELSVVQVNQCGGCTACCVQYCLPELNKPAKVPCQHLCGTGCSLHDQPRPLVCSAFECGYLRAQWSLEMRPDNCGVIFQPMATIRYDRVGDGLTLSTICTDDEIDEKNQILWSGTCLTLDIFANPPDVIHKFIYRKMKQKGIVVITCASEEGRMKAKAFSETCRFTEYDYLAYAQYSCKEQLDAIREFEAGK